MKKRDWMILALVFVGPYLGFILLWLLSPQTANRWVGEAVHWIERHVLR